jgi:hypothetical protein
MLQFPNISYISFFDGGKESDQAGGHAIAQAISQLLSTSAARVRAQVR